MDRTKPLVLLILDGWGYREEKTDNAIAAAPTPCWDLLWQTCPHTLLATSGVDVGLPPGQMGNSEVGHLHMGAGRLVPQDLTRIDNAISDGSFFANPVLLQALKKLSTTGKTLHILGLLSNGGVHSQERHFYALLQLAKEQQIKDCYVHAFLDGRDTAPRSAKEPLKALEQQQRCLGFGKIGTIIGRYYAMDRDQRWGRTQKAYDLLTLRADYHASSAQQGLEMAYARGESDEFVAATSINDSQQGVIDDGDVVIFMNFRADRVRQLAYALTKDDFAAFTRSKVPKLAACLTLTSYAKDLACEVIFPRQPLKNTFGAYIAEQGLRQLRIAETEKYAHVTYFFNGGIEKEFKNENRILVPSPKVATYDLMPEMSANEVMSHLTKAITARCHEVIIVNFANPDMVGHTGNFTATVKAITTIDKCLEAILAALKTSGGELIITADHGNAECMFDHAKGQPHTAHTTTPVPLLYLGRKAKFTASLGKLADVAPTMLYILGLPKPREMTGQSLLTFTIDQG